MSTLGPVAPKCMDGSGSSQSFATVRHATWDEVFLPGSHGNPFAMNDQGIATLHHDHVFVVIVGVWRGFSGLTAGPKSHLASIRTVENKTLYVWSRLTRLRDLVGWMLHEFWKIDHGCKHCPTFTIPSLKSFCLCTPDHLPHQPVDGLIFIINLDAEAGGLEWHAVRERG